MIKCWIENYTFEWPEKRGSLHNNISVQYINTFLQTKSLDFSLNTTTELRLSDMKLIADYPALLKINDSGDPVEFIILTKAIWHATGIQLDAANIRSTAMSANEKQYQH